jgi:hypothetical protein
VVVMLLINASLLICRFFLIRGVVSTSVFVSYRCVLVLLAVLWCVPAYWWSYALGVAACTCQYVCIMYWTSF